MKTRVIIFLGVSALVTLSFTFVSVTKQEKAKGEVTTATASKHSNEPVGGFLSEDKL